MSLLNSEGIVPKIRASYRRLYGIGQNWPVSMHLGHLILRMS